MIKTENNRKGDYQMITIAPNMRVKGYRNMLGLTQEELANKLGMSKQQYNPKELGKVPFNDKEKVILLSVFKQIDDTLTIDKLFF